MALTLSGRVYDLDMANTIGESGLDQQAKDEIMNDVPAINNRLFPIRVFDSRIVGLSKV
jgi:hypothetical protein